MIKQTKIALTRWQSSVLKELNKTVHDANDNGEPGIVFAKIDMDQEHIQAVFWPNLPGKELIRYMKMLIKYYDLDFEEIDNPPRRGEKE